MSTKLNVEGILLFEQPFTRVPYENYRKIFRLAQKQTEREYGAIQTTANDITKRIGSDELGKEDMIASIDVMISRVKTLKRKLSELHETAGKPAQDVMRERFQYLSALESIPSTNTPEFARWGDTRLDRWLVDWCLRNGKEKTAKQIAKDKDIETLVDISLFGDIRRIETALQQHSCTEALAWCSENKSALKKSKNTLEFDLRLQEYIEYCRAGHKQEAIAYLQKHLTSWQDTHLLQINQASALLAFPPTTHCGPYKRLYDPIRWANLVKTFRQSIYSLNLLPNEPLLNLSLYAGLASLKSLACYDQSTKNVDCPVCDGESGAGSQGHGLGKLAEDVPLAHHANSTIVCQITGKIMDEDNMPMAFPNGYVYSREAMEEMAAKNGGTVTCPRTGERCEFGKLRKVFIS
ncbi:Macrophage erythroblast attacher [Moniliophthora roreri MCA 2997]|uniref:Macrophage erythroblast attacher n=2 Tax=Moniliophthora roreri TaxID=221103 RepID=V2XK32_MONRO|nr:Macrophage erythroblast attacher [Moniliophthora roreri MCA 2997]KAI3607900.1 Macrophage erythroblast attacher [Moniliophthora roreri]